MRTDVLIIGSGIAGATAALRLARDREREITLVTRASSPEESNSSYAQGGIVGRGADDTSELLVEDVLQAGAGLSWPPAVRILAEEGPPLLEAMLGDGREPFFDRDDAGRPIYGLEGAHSRRRILHVGDRTGAAIMQTLLARVAQTPNIRLMTGKTAVDLIT